MKMKKTALFLSCICILFSCKKDKHSEAEDPALPEVAANGSLSGKVSQYNQFGTLYKTGLNTTTVSIDGKGYTTVTDTSGRYTLTGIPTSTYTLIFKKAGCGTMKMENISYKAGDTTIYNTGIADIPVFSISSAYARDTTWFGTLGGIYYNASAFPKDTNATVVAIIGKSAAIDLADPTSYLNYATASSLKAVDFKRFFSYSLLKDTYTFKKDSILYMKVYPIATKASSYYNDKLKTLVYTAYGTPYSTVFSLYVH